MTAVVQPTPGSISTILVGCDLSDGSDLALERAIGIALPHGARVVVVYAQADDAAITDVDNAMLEQLGEVSNAVRVEEARQLADRKAKIEAAGLVAEVVRRLGPPAEVLATLATERRAELIAVGTHGRTGISRFLLGSVAAETVRHAPCDVLVCRGPAQRAAFHHPLVAIDFSVAALGTVDHLARVCQPDTTLAAIHAWQLPTGSWGASLLGQTRFPWSTVRDAVLSGTQAQADRLTADAATHGVTLAIELIQGSPPAVLTHAAEQRNHDVIAVGAHGHRGVRRLLLGSVAESTIRHAPCSVLVVHAT